MSAVTIQFSVPFVRGKARPRVTKQGAYTPQETENAELLILAAYTRECVAKYGDILVAPRGVPVHVLIKAYEVMPDSAAKSRGDVEPFIQKPDADNIVKLVLDALNPKSKRKGKTIIMSRGAWADDAQVVRVVCTKVERKRGGAAHTDVTIIWDDERCTYEQCYDY